MKKYILSLLLFLSYLFATTTELTTIDRFYSKSRGDDVYICAHFLKYFDEYSAKRLRPFIQISPKRDFSLEVDYKEICVGNLEPDKEYTIFISKNIPLGSRIKLDRDYLKTIKTLNYAPSFSFKESGYILPQKGDISIPIEVRNINKLSVALYRINSNNLIDAINRYGFIRALEYYDLDKIENEKGYKLWQKNITLNSPKNVKKVWAINVGKFITKRQSGVYILAVTTVDRDGNPEIYNTKTQWFMISDIGLFSLEDDKGLHVYTKHLSNAKPYNDITLKLIAKNNEVLDTQIVQNGKATFAKALLEGVGGLKAQAIYAYGKNGDFSVLDFSHPPLDLSDRGVGGRSVPKGYDAFIYSNRAIFKPGEKISFHSIIKQLNQKAASNLTIVAKLIDVSLEELDKQRLISDGFGHISATFTIPKSAKRGRYKIALYASNSKEPIGILSFLVEDFVPPKIEISILKKPKFITPGQKAPLRAKVSYLTKEPLANADVEIQRVIHKAKNPFKEYKGYYFGKIDEHFSNEYLSPINTISDSNGTIKADISAKERFESSLPLAMFTTISVAEPGGRAVERSFNIFYANKEAYIGIKPNFEDDYIDLNSKASFTIIYLFHQKPTPASLSYKLIKEEPEYSWSYENGSWEYQVDYSDIKVVKSGMISIENSPTPLTLDKLEWGSYRLEVYKNGDTISSYRFSSGYWGSGGKHTPDKLPLSINKISFKPNEQLLVHIKPKFSGPILISIANFHIFKSVTVEAKEGEDIEVPFTIDKKWGSSVYVLATAFRAQDKTMGASRAIGVAHFSIKDESKILDIVLDAPKRIYSKSKLEVTISSQKAKEQQVFFTLSAVDKGVLNLTNYELPNPISYFFGKLRLGVSVRDIYGELIKAQGEHALFDQGAGDEFSSDELQDKPTSNQEKVVAFLTKKLELKDGKAKISFDIGEYQGALSLQAIAWSKDALGKNSLEVVVKDPISLRLYMPRFLVIGDEAYLSAEVAFDKDVPKDSYLLRLKAKGLKVEKSTLVLNSSAKRVLKKFRVKALDASQADIVLEVLNSKKEVIASRTYKLALKYPLPKSYRVLFNVLKSNESLDVVKLLQEANVSALLDASIRVSNKPLIPTTLLKKQLLSYEYRCAEQTTSRAFVLLDSNSSFEQSELRAAIEHLESLQKLNGGFGLWSGSDDNLWLSAYVMDFLTRAYKRGYKVSEKSLKEGLRYLENSLNRWANSRYEQEANIYALYVLARNKRVFMSDIMHFVNDTQSKVQSAISWGQLGATLALLGEKSLAKEIFSRAKESLNAPYSYSNYGGKLRDKAALIVLLSEAKFQKDSRDLLIDLALNLQKQRYLSTQELSQILRANKAVAINLGALKLKIGKSIYNAKTPYHFRSSSLKDFKPITNLGANDVWWSLSYIAIPTKESLKAFPNRGFQLTKSIYSLDGKLVDFKTALQGKRYVVVLDGVVTDSAISYPLLSDFLPAGFEIENPNISGIDTTTSLSWLKNTTTALHKEYRDDRFSAYFKPKREFRFAYIIRAVTLGKFALAPAKIEDMYQARYRAFSPYTIEQVTVLKEQQPAKKEPTLVKESNNTSAAQLQEAEYIKAATTPLGDLKPFSLYELYYLRNGIFAYIGLDFSKSNPALFKRFSQFSWYKPTIKSGAVAYSKLNKTQKNNVNKLLNEEKRRLKGLVLGDFYRVNTKELDEAFLKRYTKEQLRILRNSLIARYGYNFKDETLKKIFLQFPWYKIDTKISAGEIIDKRMNAIQSANLSKIFSVEKQKEE